MIEGGNGLYIGVKNTYILPENFINKDYVIYYRSPKVFKVTCNREISSKDIWNIKEIWGELKNRGNKGK